MLEYSIRRLPVALSKETADALATGIDLTTGSGAARIASRPSPTVI